MIKLDVFFCWFIYFFACKQVKGLDVLLTWVGDRSIDVLS